MHIRKTLSLTVFGLLLSGCSAFHGLSEIPSSKTVLTEKPPSILDKDGQQPSAETEIAQGRHQAGQTGGIRVDHQTDGKTQVVRGGPIMPDKPQMKEAEANGDSRLALSFPSRRELPKPGTARTSSNVQPVVKAPTVKAPVAKPIKRVARVAPVVAVPKAKPPVKKPIKVSQAPRKVQAKIAPPRKVQNGPSQIVKRTETITSRVPVKRADSAITVASSPAALPPVHVPIDAYLAPQVGQVVQQTPVIEQQPLAPPRQVALAPVPQQTAVTVARRAAPLMAPVVEPGDRSFSTQRAAVQGSAVPTPVNAENYVRLADGAVVAIRRIAGGSPARSAEIVRSLMNSLGTRATHHDYNTAAEKYILEGNAAAASTTRRTMLLMDLRLRDAAGGLVGDFFEQQSSAQVTANPWDALTPDMLASVGRRAADRMQRSGAFDLAPVATSVAMAPVVDDSVYNDVPPPVVRTMEPIRTEPVRSAPARVDVPPRQVAVAATPAAIEPVAAPRVAPPVQTRSGSIPIVFRGVFGAPGDGDSSLAQEVRNLLQDNGQPLAVDGTPGAIYLAAQVIKTTQGDVDNVKIIWRVETETGDSIGQVTQENNLPRGALDGSWGQDAVFAARGAHEGINKLLKTAREGIAQPG